MISAESTGYEDNDPRTDAELLRASRSNDPEAYAVFYHRHFNKLVSYFWRRTRDREASADLAAETFAAALEHADRFDPDRGVPAQWLYGIARNQLNKFWRRRKASEKARTRLGINTPALPDAGWESIETADARLDGARLAAALQRVPAKNREAVRLRVLEELPYAEIAELLDCEPGAARVRALRGIKRLQHEFDTDGELQ